MSSLPYWSLANRSPTLDANAGKRRKPGQDAARFKTDEDTGKMVIDKDDSDADGGEAVADDAYRESITSADGFKRGQNGRIKFNKDTKKRRRENEADEDVEMADADAISPGKKSKRKIEQKLGHEFRAKASQHCFHDYILLTSMDYRKQEAISKRAAWSRMHTCHLLKLQNDTGVVPKSVLPANAELDLELYSTCVCPCVDLAFSFWIVIGRICLLRPLKCCVHLNPKSFSPKSPCTLLHVYRTLRLPTVVGRDSLAS